MAIVKRRIEDNESDSVPFLREMDHPTVDEPRSDIVVKDTQCTEGIRAGGVIISVVSCEETENLPDRSRLQRNWVIHMRANNDGEKLRCAAKQWKRSLGEEHRHRGKAVAKHPHRDWQTAMYRRLNDVRKDTMPALKKIGCGMLGKDAAWKE